MGIKVPWIGSQASANPALIVGLGRYPCLTRHRNRTKWKTDYPVIIPPGYIPYIFAVSFLNQTSPRFMGLAIHKCHSISNSATAAQNMLHHNSNYTSHQILAVMNITSEHSTSHVIWFQDFSTYNKISFSHSCDHLPLNIFIPGTVHHLIYCLTVLVSRSYQWIPIDIFVQQVSRPGLTKGSIPGTLRLRQKGQG